MMFDRPTFSAGAVYIDPDVNISGKSQFTGADLKADNIAPTAWVPNLHFVAPINEQFGWGASVTSNYGRQRSSITTIRPGNTAVKPT